MCHTEIWHAVKGNVHMEKDDDEGWMDITFELEKINTDEEEEEE